LRNLTVVLAAAWIVWAAIPCARAQETAPPPAPASEVEPLPDQRPPSEYAVGVKPPPVDKTFKHGKKKVWKAVLAVLQETEVGVETADEESGYLTMKLIWFDDRRFGGNVATPPPDATKERPIGQKITLAQGHFSIEVQLAPVKGGTLVSIRPYIEERAHHLTEDRRIWVERYSNGRIEQYFFERIAKALK